MTNPNLKLLILEDSEDDALLLLRQIRKGFTISAHKRVDTEESLKLALNEQNWDVCIVDHSLPGFNGIDALRIIKQTNPNLPSLMVSGKMGEESAVEAMLNGANDYLIKGNWSRLIPAITRELNEADIRKEKLFAEEALVKKSEEQKILLDNIETHVWYLLNTQTYGAANKARASFLGKSPSELYNTSIHNNVIDPQEATTCIAHNEIVFKTKEQLTTEETLSDYKGDKRTFSVTKTPKLGRNGEVEYIVCTANDITEQKQTQADLIEAKEKAEESDRLKSEFLANISHEIRTPMNGIIGFTEFLKNENLTAQDRETYINIISQSSDELLNIVNDIVDISKIEAGQLNIYKKPFNLNQTLSDLLLVYTQKNTKNLEISADYGLPDNLSNITTDENRIKQILNNLINNAIKFTPKGEVSFGYTVEMNSKNEMESITFFVEDSGIGIAIDKQTLIFERFRQAINNTNETYRGVGLGLSISKGIVTLLEGTITVKSDLGKGSRFEFSIPLQTKKAVKQNVRETQKNHEDLILENVNLLVVEDDDINYKYIETLLLPTKASLSRASTGYEALDLFNLNEPDLVLMDIKLPGKSGLDVTKEIREFNTKTPIIAQTANAMENDRIKCLANGCNDYISKPITKNQLMQVLKLHLHK